MEVNITLLHQQSFYQGKSTSFGITTKYNEEYRHDAEKRDFVACGSAAGVAAAFGSPSKISFFKVKFEGNYQEVEFHEIEICFFHEIKIMIMRSKLDLIVRSNLFNNIDQEVDTLIMRSKFQKALCRFT